MSQSSKGNRVLTLISILLILGILVILIFVVQNALSQRNNVTGFEPLTSDQDTVIVLFPECDLAVKILKGHEYTESSGWEMDRVIQFGSEDNYFMCNYRGETMAEKLDMQADPTISYLPVNRLPSTSQNLQDQVQDKRKAIYGLPTLQRFDFILKNKPNRVYSYGYTYEFRNAVNPIVQIQPISLSSDYPKTE